MSLEVGRIKPGPGTEKKIRRRARVGGKNPGGGRKNRGGGDDGKGGDDDNNLNFGSLEESQISDKVRIGMWFLLLVVLMTFGGLVSAYIVISTNGVMEWQPFNLPPQIWISTFLILASSVAYSIFQRYLNAENQNKAKTWLLVTTVFGGLFISSQILAWFALVGRGVYVASNPYAGFFYLLTAVHAVHVLGGISALGYVLLRVWVPTDSFEELINRRSIAQIIGWYWHFMDALWIFLVLLLGFWK